MQFATIAGGAISIVSALGLGTLVVSRLGRLPGPWRLPFSLLTGVALMDAVAMLLLVSGGGVLQLRCVAIALAVIGGAALLRNRRYLLVRPFPGIASPAERCFAAAVLAALALNLLIALAPSTKIDELHYHMLVPKRIMEDNGLLPYRQPFEQAILPQLSYQVGLSFLHATGAPEAGNILSWALGAALILLIAGAATALTGSAAAGWMSGAVSAVGLYASVWHVTSGAHALGDFATVAACLLLLVPRSVLPELSDTGRLTLAGIAVCTAGSTKVSLLPLAVLLTVLAVCQAGSRIGWLKSAAIVSGLWIVSFAPAMIWSTIRCGSPFGLATAAIFHSTFFDESQVNLLSDSVSHLRRYPWTLYVPLGAYIQFAIIAIFVAAVAVCILKRRWRLLILLGIVAAQVTIVTFLLPHSIRFMGGVQFLLFPFALAAIWQTRFGGFLNRRWWTVLALYCVPWIAAQVYYARPFLEVDSGILSREAFRRRYVAMEDDFQALDRILPKNAVLFSVGTRVPSYYMPRRVRFAVKDLNTSGPVYLFKVGNWPPVSPASGCSEVVYRNPDAIVETYRTPGREPRHAPLLVERCVVSAPALSQPHKSRKSNRAQSPRSSLLAR